VKRFSLNFKKRIPQSEKKKTVEPSFKFFQRQFSEKKIWRKKLGKNITGTQNASWTALVFL